MSENLPVIFGENIGVPEAVVPPVVARIPQQEHETLTSLVASEVPTVVDTREISPTIAANQHDVISTADVATQYADKTEEEMITGVETH
ncbi:hypothetical protein KC980_01785 [candidate division WWE3 bacterium]|uniref:Uncharacterized protein n=1 Tax=candidate division WWE3 bacterium TaxID=2053526 RepID=A0A955ECU9_UNCKA|nr:hypothetical protein [candidate division WWE3 bacterium]